MKTQIHPAYVKAQVTCSCGQSFESESTKPTIHVEVCYKCHPLYTGEHKFIDTKGRVEEFQKRQKVAAQYKAQKPFKQSKKDRQAGSEGPRSLKDLLSEI